MFILCALRLDSEYKKVSPVDTSAVVLTDLHRATVVQLEPLWSLGQRKKLVIFMLLNLLLSDFD